VFNLGPMELAVILVLALLIFGPKKLPEIGKGVGQAMREFKRASRDLMDSFHDSMDDRPRPVTDTYASPSAAEPVYPYQPAGDSSLVDEPMPSDVPEHSSDEPSAADDEPAPSPPSPGADAEDPSSHEPSLVAAGPAEPDSQTAREPERTT
jgi:sec-independent protein translocase protein TatA